MHHHGWISKGLLTYLEHTPVRHLFGSHTYFQTDGARLLDAWTFALWALLLIALALLAWRVRSRFINPQSDLRLWIGLVLLVLGGSALWYSLVSEPDTDTNFWALAPSIARLPAPVYTDRYTAFDLAYLSGYDDPNVRSAGYLTDARVRPILKRRRGCFLLSQPQLERERASNLAHASTAVIFAASQHPPSGWHVIQRITATENPLASIVILCAHGPSR